MSIANPAAVTVQGTAVQVLAANPKRRLAIIQQTTANAVRIGNSAVTATTSLHLGQCDRHVIEGRNSDCPTEAIYAIREGALDGAVVCIEIADP